MVSSYIRITIMRLKSNLANWEGYEGKHRNFGRSGDSVGMWWRGRR